MKFLKEECIIGYSRQGTVVHATITDRTNGPMLGDRYKVPKTYFPNGVGKVTHIENCNVMKIENGATVIKETFWLVDMVAAAVEPDDPCDTEFMKEIST